MQRFTLIHDGSEQGWQTTYLAFHVAAQLGAPLLGLLIDTDNDKNMLAKRAAQVEVGGHAAGVAIKTQIISDFSVEIVLEYCREGDGLFIPHRLVPDEKIAHRFQELCACPLWLVAKSPDANGVVIFVDAPEEEAALINYAIALSHRLKQTLTGLILNEHLAHSSLPTVKFPWLTISDLSISTIAAALERVNASLLILPMSQFTLSKKVPLNCVIYPIDKDA